jgi:hypothetical protein
LRAQTKSKLDRAVVAAHERLVSSITVHLQDAGKAGQLWGDLVGAAAMHLEVRAKSLNGNGSNSVPFSK